MSSRSKSRKHAVDAVYGGLVRESSIAAQFDDNIHGAKLSNNPWFGYAREIAYGVSDTVEELDETIDASSKNWSVQRMPRIDLAILRVASWEILFNKDVPDAVAISEAMQLADELSTEESAKFIAGVLSRVQATKGDDTNLRNQVG
ncbi:transcription antitermination factor NusB [Humidisolicoccus flavus]|uniref:transcription antitermination factor NusB n=1 Tax=Humidisolicoccus flavus TaxID=3111414 RepID=UPI00324FBFB1